MRNITFSANESLIARARALAQAKGVTLNDEFREWLAGYAAQQGQDLKLAETLSLIGRLAQPLVDESSRLGSRSVRERLSERERAMVARLDGAATE